MNIKTNVISPTGTVHVIKDHWESITGVKRYMTKCRHVNMNRSFSEELYHEWEETNKPVTCKRCLKMINKC